MLSKENISQIFDKGVQDQHALRDFALALIYQGDIVSLIQLEKWGLKPKNASRLTTPLKLDLQNPIFEHSIIEASKNGHIEVVRFLISRGADVNLNQSQAFVCAAQNNYDELAYLLYLHGAKLNTHHFAALKHYLERPKENKIMLQLIISESSEHKIDSVFKEYLQLGKLSAIKRMCRNGYNINHTNCFVQVIEKRDESLLDYFLENKLVDINADRQDAIYRAIALGDLETIEKLFKYGYRTLTNVLTIYAFIIEMQSPDLLDLFMRYFEERLNLALDQIRPISGEVDKKEHKPRFSV